MSGVEFSPVGPLNAAPRALLGTGTTHAGVDGLKDNGHRVDGILPAWAWPRKLSPPSASFTTQPEPAEAESSPEGSEGVVRPSYPKAR